MSAISSRHDRLPFTMVEQGVGTTTYAYDAYGRPSSLTNPFGEMTSWTYDTAGRVSVQTNGNGTEEAYAYDARSRPLSITTRDGEGGTLRSRSMGYNAVSNVTSVNEGGVQTLYSYDLIDQLESETRLGYACSYTYDDNGNRLTRTLNGVQEIYSCDSADKLTSVTWSGGSKLFGYDAAGRTTSITTGSGTTNLAYDFEGRVTLITYPGGATNTNTYNGLDTRVGMMDSAGTKTFKRNGIGVTSPVLSDGQANYTYGLSERRGGVSTFSHAGLKSNDAQTGVNQTIAASRAFDAFGNLGSTTGTWRGPFGYGAPYGYQSDADSGLKLLGIRYYDSSIGRFLSRDPVGDGRNWYSYCRNSPCNLADPGGDVPILIPVLIAFLLSTTVAVAPESIDDTSPSATRGYSDDLGRSKAQNAGLIAGGGFIGRMGVKIIGLAYQELKAPKPKKGSAGGETARKLFSAETKKAGREENPDTCVFCRMKTDRPHCDHAIPKVKGGNALLENLNVTCPHCNWSKGSGLAPKSAPPGYKGGWPPRWWPKWIRN